MIPAASQSHQQQPIVLLDSGLGGLTIARELRRVLPAEDLLYFGDTARVPYGSRTPGTIKQYVREIISYFENHRPKHVVIACNTATALALPEIRAEFPELSISGVIEPGSAAAVDALDANCATPTIGVIATEATIRSGAYERAIVKRRIDAKVLPQATPLLVPIIEEGRSSEDPLVKLALQQYLQPMLDAQIDVLVLGCTHYPILKREVMEVVGERVAVIDSAERCAQDVAGLLGQRQALAARERPGTLACFVTDDPARFARLASRFLGAPIETPTWVAPEDLAASVRPVPMIPAPRLAEAV